MPRNDSMACIRCFEQHRGCFSRGMLCCSRAHSNQHSIDASPSIGQDTLEACIIQKLGGCCDNQLIMLPSNSNSRFVLEYPSSSDLEIGTSYPFLIPGGVKASKKDLAAQLDGMVLHEWAPKIQTRGQMTASIESACISIGYCHMLIFGKVQKNSGPPFNKHDLSPILADFAITRMSDLIEDLMRPVRYVQLELDSTTRPALVLWYLYLIFLPPKLKTVGHCQMFDNSDSELFQHVQNILQLFLQELQERFATDCKNKAHWAAAFKSQRELERNFDAMKTWKFSQKLVSHDDVEIGDSPDLQSRSYDISQSESSGLNSGSCSGLSQAFEFASQPSSETTQGMALFDAISVNMLRSNENAEGNRNLGYNSCENRKAVLPHFVANDMSGIISSIRPSTDSAIARAPPNNLHLGWGNNATTFKYTYTEYGSADGSAASNASLDARWPMPSASILNCEPPPIDKPKNQRELLASPNYEGHNLLNYTRTAHAGMALCTHFDADVSQTGCSETQFFDMIDHQHNFPQPQFQWDDHTFLGL